MTDLKGKKCNKSRLRLKTLPFFLSSSSTSNDETKPTKKFGEEKRVVGLGIVAALNSESLSQDSQKAVFSVSPRSKPIPIFSKRSSEDDDDDEEYTCVISHVGNNLMKKREYFDDGSKRKTSYWVSGGGLFCGPFPPPPPPVVAIDGLMVVEDADFLSSCCLCKKKLHGLDIFMYRGEKAFCSEECRYKQIRVDERKDKYTRKHSGSPCSSPTPMPLLQGMAAA